MHMTYLCYPPCGTTWCVMHMCVHMPSMHMCMAYLSLCVYPLHGAGGEEGEDEPEGAYEVTWEGVYEGELLKHHSRTVETRQQNH